MVAMHPIMLIGLVAILVIVIATIVLLNEWRASKEHEREKEMIEREQQDRVIEAIEEEK